ncbi:MAG: ABC transporter ATPase [Polaribacter sp.]
MPDTSRIWIYQSNREFSSEEVNVITLNAKNFIENWTRHGDDLKGSFTVVYNRFVVIAVDENFANVSGCSIDASVRFIQQIQSELNIDLLNKLHIAFKTNDDVNSVSLNDFRSFIASDKITQDTIVFNNLVNTKADFESKWEVPAKESWHQRLF